VYGWQDNQVVRRVSAGGPMMASEWKDIIEASTAALIALFGGLATLLALLVTNRHNRKLVQQQIEAEARYRKDHLRFQKLYDRQAEIVMKINDKLCCLENIAVDVARRYLNLNTNSIEAWEKGEREITKASKHFWPIANALDALIHREEAYVPRSLSEPAYSVKNGLFHIMDRMCRKQSEDRGKKMELWKELIHGELKELHQKWVTAYRAFIGEESCQGGDHGE
jgi:hypothetical protein